jgi:hypothetical protein
MSKFLKVFAVTAMIVFGSVSSVNAKAWYDSISNTGKDSCNEVSGGHC